MVFVCLSLRLSVLSVFQLYYLSYAHFGTFIGLLARRGRSLTGYLPTILSTYLPTPSKPLPPRPSYTSKMALTKEVIILLVIVGCVVFTLMGYSIHYLATNGFHGEGGEPEMGQEQRQYMRELRMKQLHWMAREAREARGARRAHDVETPVSGVYSTKEGY
ncbi:hypothetical protein ASPCAL12917 [Aspergillus calidoustus]|uniref:Uncharacterized protein n=1 Tax=Aspergillus calidoustus TaxID=454130 RepID=A0A0U5CGR3_ASPCI|nr:hypothetical protein ASPCAL12917 [Aspergillus calidoustus]